MKFNQVSKRKNQTVNYEGAPAYRLSPEWNLYASAVTSSLSDKFYETTSDRLEAQRDLIRKNDPQFVARLAVYAREKMNLRSIPLVLAAYRELSQIASGYTTKVMNALEEAVTVTAENIAGFSESTRVLVACDVSGSMRVAISPKSKVQNYDIGLMLGMLLKSRCKNVVSGIFGDIWKIVNLPDTSYFVHVCSTQCKQSTSSGVLSNVDALHQREGEVGYSTNGYLVVEDLLNRKQVMDKIMIFTDCQLWNSFGGSTQLKDVWKKYKSIAPEAKLYLFDLAGYGNVPLEITDDDVHLIAGWSDKIFDILQAIDNGSDALKEIKSIEI